MRNIVNSITASAILSLFAMNARSQELQIKPSSQKNDAAKELYYQESDSEYSNSFLPTLTKEERVEIPNFKLMYNALNRRSMTMQFDGKERILNEKSGSVRVDIRSIYDHHLETGSLFVSDFDERNFMKEVKKVNTATPPQEYSGAIYFKKGFVHQISKADKMEHGGGTLSAPLGTTFNAEEDGKPFTQVNLEEMVQMAIETDGFEISLNFNADQDGEDVIYTPEYLDAEDGKIRKNLTDALKDTGIPFEGINANKVLTDYRQYVTKKIIEFFAKSYLSQFHQGSDLDGTVDTFMEEKFYANTETFSNGSKNASLAGHDQSERAGNVTFQKMTDERKSAYIARRDNISEEHNLKNCQNHTHIGLLEDMASINGEYRLILGARSDVGTKAIIKSTGKRVAILQESSEADAKSNMLDIQISGNVTNLTIDNITVLFMQEGEITSEYNKDEDQIDVKLDGRYFAKITWQDAKEKGIDIDPSRIMIGKINDDGIGYAKPASNIDENLIVDRRKASGLNPITDMIEHTSWLSTHCKQLYLKADKNNDEYAALLKDFDIDSRLDDLTKNYTHNLGKNMEGYIDRFRSQYTIPSSELDPTAVMDEHLIAYEIAKNYFPELELDLSEPDLIIDYLSALYKKEIFIDTAAQMTTYSDVSLKNLVEKSLEKNKSKAYFEESKSMLETSAVDNNSVKKNDIKRYEKKL